MQSEVLAEATDRIRALITRHTNPLLTLEAVFVVTEQMNQETAKAVLQQLIRQRYLCQMDADLAQMLATKLGVEVQWSHLRFGTGEWEQGRGNS